MTSKFDKIYVLSLITNKDRQEFIKEQFSKLNLDFEFIYGIDFLNIRYDALHTLIFYPEMFDSSWQSLNNDKMYDGRCKNFSCTLSHYMAVLYAYNLGYNNVLILEDDIALIKDSKLIEYYLNNIPEDADFVTWDPRFLTPLEQKVIIKNLKNLDENDYWYHLDNNIKWLCGGMMYGLMNRKSMELYLNNQRTSMHMSDHVYGFFRYPTVKRYIAAKCICTDQYNLEKDFNYDINCAYRNTYHEMHSENKISTEIFNLPHNFQSLVRIDLEHIVKEIDYDKEQKLIST